MGVPTIVYAVRHPRVKGEKYAKGRMGVQVLSAIGLSFLVAAAVIAFSGHS